MKIPSRAEVEALRRKYPAGTRVELLAMSDCQAPPPGTLGTCIAVDDIGNLIMRWDNACGLSLIPEVDSFRVLKEAEQDG